MAIVVTKNATFKALDKDSSLLVKPHAASRERFAVVEITYGAADNYVTGGNTVDFSVVGKFIKVYACDIIHRSKGVLASFVPAASDAAATGKIKLFGVDPGAVGGAIVDLPELPNASTVTNNLVLRAIIRGN